MTCDILYSISDVNGMYVQFHDMMFYVPKMKPEWYDPKSLTFSFCINFLRHPIIYCGIFQIHGSSHQQLLLQPPPPVLFTHAQTQAEEKEEKEEQKDSGCTSRASTRGRRTERVEWLRVGQVQKEGTGIGNFLLGYT